MAGRINKIVYDENVFQVSPFAESCTPWEHDDRVLLMVGGLSDLFTKYANPISENHAPTYQGVPGKNPLTMAVTMRGLDEDPVVMFHVLDSKEGKLLSTHTMKPGHYFSQQDEIPAYKNFEEHAALEYAWNICARQGSEVRAFTDKAAHDLYAHEWKREYFEQVFDGRLSGDDQFWNELYTQLDTTFIGVRSQMINARLNEGKQIIHMYDHANYRLPAPDAV